jgi:hypothetical protein
MDNEHMDTALLHSRPASNSTTMRRKEVHLFMVVQSMNGECWQLTDDVD